MVCVLRIDLRRREECNACVRFSFEKLSKNLGVPVESSRGIFPVRESLLVKIDDDAGNSACGECAPWAGFGGETIAQAEAFLKKCGGKMPAEIPADLPCVAHAFSVAKFFLETSADGNILRPENKLCAKLIRRSREDTPACVSEKILRERENGFSVFKVKIGLETAAEELRFCEKILTEAPTGTRIRFDANGAFSEEILPELARLSESSAVEYFEQPLPASERNDAKVFEFSACTNAKFALDESVREPWAFPQNTCVVAVVKPLLVADFPRLLAWLENPSGPAVALSTVFENSFAGTRALYLACVRLAASRALAFGLG